MEEQVIIDEASAFKSKLKETYPGKEVKFVVVDAIGQNFEVIVP